MCPGCYKPEFETYCPSCRNKLFDGKKVSHVLNIDPPSDENLSTYYENTKHLSVSGVQLKYSLKLDGDELKLTEKSGKYLLKPIPPAVHIRRNDQAPENEHLTMQIASQIFNIDTAENAMIFFKDGTPAYLTRRFDKKPNGDKYLQEDFAQLLGQTQLSHGKSFKYDGTYELVARIMRQYVTDYQSSAEKLLTLLLFNFLFSNGDAHLKNFSLMESSETGDYGLSKAYDLMCTALHTPYETEVALDLYENDLDEEFYAIEGRYGAPHFRELGKRFGLPPARVNEIIEYLLSKKEQVIAMIQHSYLSDEAKGVYQSCYEDKLALMGITRSMIKDHKGPVRFMPRRRTTPIEGTIIAFIEENKYLVRTESGEVQVDGDMMIEVVQV